MRPPEWTHVRYQFLDSGIGATIDIDNVSKSEQIVVACMQAVAIWNAIEMVLIVFMTFKRRRGLYFWSMIIATVGVAVYATGFIVNDFELAPTHIAPALLTVSGWTPMVTCQSMVLYSRLHLLDFGDKILRAVLIMIIFNAITQQMPIAVLVIGSNSGNSGRFLIPYSVYEKIEVTVFFVQETLISGLYLWKSVGFLGSQRHRSKNAASKVTAIIRHLILVNILVICFDITILALEYSGMYLIQTSYKAFVYSVKLKCEVSILNRLVDFVKEMRKADYSFRITEQMQREWETILNTNFGEIKPPGETRLATKNRETASKGVSPSTNDLEISLSYPESAGPLSGHHVDPETTMRKTFSEQRT